MDEAPFDLKRYQAEPPAAIDSSWQQIDEATVNHLQLEAERTYCKPITAIAGGAMEPSKYQIAILDWLKNGQGHGCCNAVAGSGKSTTLKLGALALQEAGLSPDNIKIIVFGKANSLDLINKFGTDWKESISTLHSAGWSLVKRELSIKNPRGLIQSGKYRKIAQLQNFIASRQNPDSYLEREGAIAKDDDFVKLLDLVRLTNAEPTAEAIRELCYHFELPDVYEFSIVAAAVAECLAEGKRQARAKVCFDFTDQIWLPVQWHLGDRPWFRPYRFVLVDECQDLNATQLELSLMLAGSEGRLLFVGDPRQAIMGFAGADNRSYWKIVDRTRATQLPLSLCYRCPSEHIKLVKRIFPQIPIEPRPDAPDGAIVQCGEADLNSFLQVGDMVISRKTAPLVSLCIRLIARGIKATVKGRDIGESIKRDLEAIAKVSGFTYDRFNEAADAYQAEKERRYRGLDNEEQLKESLKDKLDSLRAIYRNQPSARSIADLEEYIDSLFSDDISPITLSTCHRAKGLEGDRIFIHKADDMPMKWKHQQAWQLEQEENLLYVALTRSKSELFIVGNPDWLKLDDDEPATEQFPAHVEVFKNLAQDSELTTVNDLQLDAMETIEKPLKQWLNLGLITLEAGTQIPTRHSQVTIDDYADQMQDEQNQRWEWNREPLPRLYYDGENYYPGDGHHRIRAAGQAGKEAIYCEVHPGTLRDAIFYSLSANRFHGLPRSNADKRSAVEIALKDEEWQQMSDRAIADHCGVSPPFVGKIRAHLVESGTVNVSSERTDRKGRRINTSNIGTKPKESASEAEDLPSAQFDQTEAPEPPATAEGSLLQMDLTIANLCERHGAKQVALWALDECSPAELAELEKEIPLIRWERGE